MCVKVLLAAEPLPQIAKLPPPRKHESKSANCVKLPGVVVNPSRSLKGHISVKNLLES